MLSGSGSTVFGVFSDASPDAGVDRVADERLRGVIDHADERSSCTSEMDQ